MTTTDITIRAVEPGDLPDLTEAWSQPRFIWGTLQMPYTSLDAQQKRFATLPANVTNLAAIIDGKVIGSASLHPAEHARRRHSASVGMGVHDAYAGRGAGTALMAALLEQADRWLNITRVELTVWADNARAIGLYERAGFEREGLLRRYAFRDGEFVDALTMARLKE
ncbi:MAG TPA: GNAT family N-acetyltransferase [Rhizomicrobium sp.]|jgi:putative acetyltransferase|nr:GNAT family N-acetyltransferase [Rhizomicrobium sp.]